MVFLIILRRNSHYLPKRR